MGDRRKCLSFPYLQNRAARFAQVPANTLFREGAKYLLDNGAKVVYLSHAMNTATVTREIELAGLWIEVEADFAVDYVDNGFDHEFGTEHEWEWEIEECEDARILSDVPAYVTELLADYGRTNRNRAWKKQRRQWVRKVNAAFAALDCNDPRNFPTDEIEEAAGEQCGDPPDPPEREYDPCDREPGIGSFAYD